MSRRRCFLRCESKSSLHLLSKHENVKSQWLQFIFTVTPQQHNPKLHFTDDCFLNLGEVNAEFAKRLFIKDGAVTLPTLFGPSCASESQLVSICIVYVIFSTECPNCVCVVYYVNPTSAVVNPLLPKLKRHVLCKNHFYRVFEHSCVAAVCENSQPIMVKIQRLFFF